MRKVIKLLLVIVLLAAMVLSSCSRKDDGVGVSASAVPREAQIILYGEELHGERVVLEKEFTLWNDHYHNDGLRHLFIEAPYFTGEYLNEWMHAENDDILEELYSDWENTASHTPAVKDFYQKIKTHCPATIFHGTDIGHQYDSIGIRYLGHLERQGLKYSDQYALTEEAIDQGRYFAQSFDDIYRENAMTMNFVREFDNLGSIRVVGFYGVSHTNPEAMDFTDSVPCMAKQLKRQYGETIYSRSISV